ncbi:TerD family protein [Crassaminicella thermophila]|uniref:TerD family protein n=1 Tax=Crassaminicella thermophila TaxID=2599308 RepID=UPI00143CF2FE|nr:TerD family protein [Crassaminicella thermophila]
MSKLLIKGEKVVIGNLNEGVGGLKIKAVYPNSSEYAFHIDFFIFMVDKNNKVYKDNIVFYNNPISTCKMIRYREDYTDIENIKTIEIDLNGLAENFEKIIFSCSIYKNTADVENVNLLFQIFDQMTNQEMFQINETVDIKNNETVIIGEIYQYKDLWKFNTVKYQYPENLLNSIKKLFNITVI